MAELDWRNPDDYAYAEEYTLHQWAWEFLRRNPAYRDAYFAYEPYAEKEYHGRLKAPEEWTKCGELFRAASDPWSLGYPVDPRLCEGEGKPLFMGAVGVRMPVSWDAKPFLRDHLWPGYPHQVAFVFDFHHSIETQIEIAADHLRRFARHIGEKYHHDPPRARRPKGLRVREFRRYIRILDARLANASIGEIGRELFKGRSQQRGNVKSMTETAEHMAREGYRELLLLPPRGDLSGR